MASLPQNNQVNPQQPQRQGSGFTNLSRILQANRGNRLGETLQSGITGGAQQVRQQLGDTRNQFQQASDTANLASDQNQQIRQNVLQNIASGQTDLTPDQVNQFKQFRGGAYTGPTGLDTSKVAGLTGRAQELQNQAKNPLSESTLQSTVGVKSNQPYTRGEIGLDRTLLGTINPQILGQTRSAVRGLPQNIQREQETAQNLGTLRQNQAQQFGTDTRAQLGTVADQNQAGTGALGQISSGINKNVQDYQTQQAQDYARLQNALATRNVSNSPELSFLKGGLAYGLSPQALQSYVSENAPATKESVASTTQRAQLDALSKLAGSDQTFLGNPAQTAYDPTKAVQFNKDLLQSDLARAKQTMEAVPELNSGYGTPADLYGATNSISDYTGKPSNQATIGDLIGALPKMQQDLAYWQSSGSSQAGPLQSRIAAAQRVIDQYRQQAGVFQ